MPGDPILNHIHGLRKHHFFLGQMIQEKSDELVRQGNFSLDQHLSLDFEESVSVQAGHVECVVEEGSDFGVWCELFIFLVEVFVLEWGGDVNGSDEVFAPFFDIVEFEDLC